MLRRRTFIASGPVVALAQQSQTQDPPFVLPDQVEMRKGVEYARYGPRAMHLDLFLPKQRATVPMPMVIYVHGGGWRNGSSCGFPSPSRAHGNTGIRGRLHRVSAQRRSHLAGRDSRRQSRRALGALAGERFRYRP